MSASKTPRAVAVEVAWLCGLCVRLRHSSVGGVTLKCCCLPHVVLFPIYAPSSGSQGQTWLVKTDTSSHSWGQTFLCCSSHNKQICVYRPPRVDLTCQFHSCAKATRSSCLLQLGNKAVTEFGIGSSPTLSRVTSGHQHYQWSPLVTNIINGHHWSPTLSMVTIGHQHCQWSPLVTNNVNGHHWSPTLSMVTIGHLHY